MTDNRKGPKGREALEEIEARLGTVFGALGDAFKGAMDIANSVESEGSDGAHRSQDISRGPVRAQTSVRVRIGALDADAEEERDVARPVGRSDAKAAEHVAPQEARTLQIDSNLEAGIWTLTAEVPGVAGDQVTFGLSNGILTIKAAGTSNYFGSAEAPRGLDPSSLTHTVTNGILEVSGQVGPGRRDE